MSFKITPKSLNQMIKEPRFTNVFILHLIIRGLQILLMISFKAIDKKSWKV
jgi:hypothetical protein